jgi:hypothetical protein
VAEAGHDPKVVGDQHHRHTIGPLQTADQRQYLGLDGNVQPGGGFVGDEEFGPAGQSHSDQYPLAHTAGQFVGILAHPCLGGGDAHLLQQAHRFPPGIPTVMIPVVQEYLHDVLVHPFEGIEGGHGVLKYHGNILALNSPEGFFRQTLQIHPIKGQFFRLQGGATGQHSDNGAHGQGFPAAAFPHKAQDLPLPQGQIHPPQYLDPPPFQFKGTTQPPKFQQGRQPRPGGVHLRLVLGSARIRIIPPILLKE